MRALTAQIMIGLISIYQQFSRLTPRTCKYYPSCSHYTVEAIQTHGVVTGIWYGVRRLGRCHPWAAGGYDPVPGTRPLITVKRGTGNT